MNTYDPKLKKHIKNRKLYNVGPLVTMDNIDKIETGWDVFIEMKHLDDKWFYFIQHHLTRCEMLPFPFEEQLQFILLSSTPNIQTQLIKSLKKITTYNPNTDPIPINELPNNLTNYILRKKEELISIKMDLNQIFHKNNIIGIYTLKQYSKELENIFNYFKIDILIFANQNKLMFKINNYEPKFYEIKGKNIDIENILSILMDYGGKPKQNNDFYELENNIEKGELIDIIKTNIS